MRTFIACLVLLPSIASAQLPGIGSIGRGRMPGKLPRAPGIDIPKPVNAVNLLVEHRPELALTDTQFVRVLAIKRVLDSTNSPLMRRLDSLQRVFKNAPIFVEPSRARSDSLAQARAVARETVADIEDNIAEARERAFALLSPPQVGKAEQIEEKARKTGEAPGRGRL